MILPTVPIKPVGNCFFKELTENKMQNLQHTGLYLTNQADKNKILKMVMHNGFLQQYQDLSLLHGELFSTITIDKLIDEEYRHDKIIVSSEENTELSTMSSGQQKKALLSYLIAQKPDYLLLDDIYSNVDKATQQQITKTLTELSSTTIIIQVFYRKRDVLPFIEQILSIDPKNNITDSQSREEFINNREENHGKKLFRLPDYFQEKTVFDDNLIELNSVSVSYGEKKVLNNVNWTIKSGEFWQLVGPNGSGKSTLVSMISGDNPKAYGQNMVLFGRRKGSGETIWDIKRNIGYFTPGMMVHFTRNETVENMLISGLNDSVGLYVKPTDLQKDMAESWIAMLGDAFRGKMFQQLSVGQQRMVMVARAMIKHPPLLILDEPTIELDDANSELFIEMINAIAAERKMAVIYVSHRDEEALKPDLIFELVKTENGSTGKILAL